MSSITPDNIQFMGIGIPRITLGLSFYYHVLSGLFDSENENNAVALLFVNRRYIDVLIIDKYINV